MRFQGRLQVGFGFVPNFIGTYPFFRTGGQREFNFVETEVFVHFVHHLAATLYFLANLSTRTEDMPIILHEATHPHQAVQRAGRFVAVADTKFGVAHR